MSKLLVRAAILLGVAIAGVLWWRANAQPKAMSADVIGFLSQNADTNGYAQVLGPEPVVFPAAAGPHPDHQTEWWYYTGNLSSTAPGGGRYGYQLTFFRRALASPAQRTAGRRSAWAADQVYLGHFATSDIAAGRHAAAERLARGAAGLAGAEADPFRVWLEGWFAKSQADASPDPGRADAKAGDWQSPVHLAAADGETAIDLVVAPVKAPVLHGDGGYSRKGDAPGSASMYYSFTRLRTTGRITTAAGSALVEGWSWMDHEWSTSALSAQQTGWDWFALQLDDDTELMLFQLREKGGGVSATSSGTLVEANSLTVSNGVSQAGVRLAAADFAIQPNGRTWESPRTGARYPAGWQVGVPGADLVLEVTPLIADQELDVGFKYWEGAVSVSGRRHGRALNGVGYVELTGYAPSDSGSGLPGMP